MCDPSQGERRSMSVGICCSQNDIGSPRSLTSKPFTDTRWAAAAKPYGPAPTIATSHFSIGSVSSGKLELQLLPLNARGQERI